MSWTKKWPKKVPPETRYYKGHIKGKLIAKQSYMKTGYFKQENGVVIVAPLRMLWRHPKA